jgi:hypothetical protein
VRSAVFSISLKPAICFIRSAVLADVDFADRNTDLTDGVAKSLRQHIPLVVAITLRRDVVEVKRMGVGLIGEGGAMAEDDHKSSSAQYLCDLLIIGRRRACHDDAGHVERAGRDRPRDNGSSRQIEPSATPQKGWRACSVRSEMTLRGRRHWLRLARAFPD